MDKIEIKPGDRWYYRDFPDKYVEIYGVSADLYEIPTLGIGCREAVFAETLNGLTKYTLLEVNPGRYMIAKLPLVTFINSDEEQHIIWKKVDNFALFVSTVTEFFQMFAKHFPGEQNAEVPS